MGGLKLAVDLITNQQVPPGMLKRHRSGAHFSFVLLVWETLQAMPSRPISIAEALRPYFLLFLTGQPLTPKNFRGK